MLSSALNDLSSCCTVIAASLRLLRIFFDGVVRSSTSPAPASASAPASDALRFFDCCDVNSDDVVDII